MALNVVRALRKHFPEAADLDFEGCPVNRICGPDREEALRLYEIAYGERAWRVEWEDMNGRKHNDGIVVGEPRWICAKFNGAPRARAVVLAAADEGRHVAHKYKAVPWVGALVAMEEVV